MEAGRNLNNLLISEAIRTYAINECFLQCVSWKETIEKINCENNSIGYKTNHKFSGHFRPPGDGKDRENEL